jgi:hypothetical protein
VELAGEVAPVNVAQRLQAELREQQQRRFQATRAGWRSRQDREDIADLILAAMDQEDSDGQPT